MHRVRDVADPFQGNIQCNWPIMEPARADLYFLGRGEGGSTYVAKGGYALPLNQD